MGKTAKGAVGRFLWEIGDCGFLKKPPGASIALGLKGSVASIYDFICQCSWANGDSHVSSGRIELDGLFVTNYTKLSKHVGYNRRDVKAAVDSLVKKGLVERVTCSDRVWLRSIPLSEAVVQKILTVARRIMNERHYMNHRIEDVEDHLHYELETVKAQLEEHRLVSKLPH